MVSKGDMVTNSGNDDYRENLSSKNLPTLSGEQLTKDLGSWEAPSGEEQLLQYVDDLLIATKTQEACLEWMYQDVEIVVTNIVNPASFLSGSMGEPVIHECLEAIEATCSSCLDLKDTLPENTETWSTDGSSCVISGRHAGKAKFHTELHLDRSKNFQFLRFKRSRRKEFRPNIPLAHWIYNGL
ncbi:hypothetical protein DUI87_26163 [Hirundo rustica rustica]|uniref:Reverse transcriptase domain-containing protein n=1 Tax=Hirundo rustica rustica TaxID=333673 RepID=A0A3M0J908_HIRRU|nr:hypothetical protein DUI87_26163 [Hirundo rustica rustica]